MVVVVNWNIYIIHHIPYTIYHIPYTIHHIPYSLHQAADDPAMAKTLANFISKQAETRMARERGMFMCVYVYKCVWGVCSYHTYIRMLMSTHAKFYYHTLGIEVDDDKGADKAASFADEKKVDKYVAPGARLAALQQVHTHIHILIHIHIYTHTLQASGAPSSSALDGTETTLRVSNLTKAVTEDDLRDLFGRYGVQCMVYGQSLMMYFASSSTFNPSNHYFIPCIRFGRIARISLPRDAEKVPRGFAYIAYDMRRDAEKAMEVSYRNLYSNLTYAIYHIPYTIQVLQGYGYDHLIIKLEWAKPNQGGGGG
ncbi:hypothetical protein EON63_22980, partial [archaeon]